MCLCCSRMTNVWELELKLCLINHISIIVISNWLKTHKNCFRKIRNSFVWCLMWMWVCKLETGFMQIFCTPVITCSSSCGAQSKDIRILQLVPSLLCHWLLATNSWIMRVDGVGIKYIFYFCKPFLHILDLPSYWLPSEAWLTPDIDLKRIYWQQLTEKNWAHSQYK